MKKIDLKRPLIAGFTWFLMTFSFSEISYRAANFLYEYNDGFSEALYQFSDKIAWPASILYTIRHKDIVKKSLDLYKSKNKSSDAFSYLDDGVEKLNEDELWEVSEQLDSLGFKGSPSTLDEYIIYLSTCATSGVIVIFLSAIFLNVFNFNRVYGDNKMNIIDSGNVKNSVRARSVIVALIVHIYLAVFTLGVSLIILLIIGLITNSMVKKEIEEASSSKNRFKKNFPFKYYGQVFGSFQHVFSSSEIIEKKLYDAIESELQDKTTVSPLESFTITDVDNDLSKYEDRIFFKASSTPTSRGTAITLVLNQSNFGKMQSIEWRVLGGGFVDRDKKFNLISYSIFTFIFWVIPYLKKEHDLLVRVRTIYPGSYNDSDVVTQIRCIHDAVFNAMINELEKNDIDTSELKVQKMQVMNINVGGGKVNIGNVVQGAMNKVSSSAKGTRS